MNGIVKLAIMFVLYHLARHCLPFVQQEDAQVAEHEVRSGHSIFIDACIWICAVRA